MIMIHLVDIGMNINVVNHSLEVECFKKYTNTISMIIRTLFIAFGLGLLISNKSECTLDDFRCRENIPSMLRIQPDSEEK